MFLAAPLVSSACRNAVRLPESRLPAGAPAGAVASAAPEVATSLRSPAPVPANSGSPGLPFASVPFACAVLTVAAISPASVSSRDLAAATWLSASALPASAPPDRERGEPFEQGIALVEERSAVAAAFAGAGKPQVHPGEFAADDVRVLERRICFEAEAVAHCIEAVGGDVELAGHRVGAGQHGGTQRRIGRIGAEL